MNTLATTAQPLPTALSKQQVEQYQRDGFLVLRSAFSSDEIGQLADESQRLLELTDLMDTSNIRCRWQNHVETGECTFDCFDPVIDIGPVCRYFAYDERILAPLRDIYGDTAHLFKDKLIFKRPGMTGYALHQDYISWPEFPASFITVIVAIDATSAENGATEVFPGYHQQGYLSDRDGEYHEVPAELIDFSTGVVLDLKPGDVAFFSGFTPHRSAANQSSQWRRQLYLSYNAGRDGGSQREAHYQQFQQWLVKKYAEYGKANVYFR